MHYVENPHSAFFMRKIRMFPYAENSKNFDFLRFGAAGKSIQKYFAKPIDKWDPIAYNDTNNKHITFYTGGKYG